ncbi:MAG TPA: cytochrome d ubiquinol oxidase subunit II [Gammaproteobacteria bacterium]|nr:cytochrome d ubiquinol oxidase subunit II [Gammaproteobacteria bacterium]
MDYETLRLIWWLFLTVLLTGFALMDGFDLGVAAQLLYVARDDEERRVAINSIGPVWDGNQVWFVLGGGAVFAAFPLLYAVAFSGFYAAMFLVLVTFIVRPVGFDFRNKLQAPVWRETWDRILSVAAIVAALLFGVAVGNLFLGVPFSFDENLRMHYDGGLLGLVRPFPLLCGAASLAMLLMHGAAYLRLKTDGRVAARARHTLLTASLFLFLLLVAGGFWVGQIEGYAPVGVPQGDGPSNPLLQHVARAAGAWLGNYSSHPWMMAAPALALVSALAAAAAGWRKWDVAAFVASSLAVAGTIFTAGFSLFPFLLPSDVAPSQSLTIWDASSSQHTLFIMVVAVLIFLPVILVYTGWVFRVLRGKVTAAYIRENDRSLY